MVPLQCGGHLRKDNLIELPIQLLIELPILLPILLPIVLPIVFCGFVLPRKLKLPGLCFRESSALKVRRGSEDEAGL